MKRRTFLQMLMGVTPVAFLGKALSSGKPPGGRRLLLQTSPVAGFQYYRGEEIWEEMHIGDSLRLVREPGNLYDEKAVEVYWKSKKIGYLPRVENKTISELMDRGHRLSAQLVDKQESWDPWERLTV